MAPVMENQQLLATNTPAAQQEAMRDAMRAALAFGGADITKEQRAAWEKENAEYRAASRWKRGEIIEGYEPGTRVTWRPPNAEQLSYKSAYKTYPATVVEPGTPEAGTPGYIDPKYWRSPGPDYVAVRLEDSPIWLWRHKDDLEVLPPLEKFPVGTKVQWEYRGKTWTGTVGEIPRSGHDKEYWHDQKKHIWIDNDVGPDEKPWGGWLPPEWLTKRKK